MAGYRINLHKSLASLYATDKYTDMEIMNRFPLIVSLKGNKIPAITEPRQGKTSTMKTLDHRGQRQH